MVGTADSGARSEVIDELECRERRDVGIRGGEEDMM